MPNSTNRYVTPVGLQQPAAADLSDGTTGTGAVVQAASPTLTGTPAAPTATVGTNTTQLATTAFVLANGGGGVFTGARRQTIITADGSTTIFQTIGEPTVSVTLGGGTTVVKTPSVSPKFGPSVFNSTNSSSVSLGWSGAVNNYVVGRNIAYSFIGYINNITNERAWHGISDQTLATMSASDNPAGNYAAFRFSTAAGDTSWQCITKDGTTQTIVSSGVAPVNDVAQRFAIVFQDSVPNILFYINSSLVATTSTHLPTANTIVMWFASSFNTAGSFANGLGIEQIQIFEDF